MPMSPRWPNPSSAAPPNSGARPVRFTHVSLIARDAQGLARFYSRVFGCTPLRPARRLSGPAVDRGNGVPGSDILSIWLDLLGAGGAFLELHQYTVMPSRPAPQVNAPGFGHIAFAVPDIAATARAILAAGGSAQGEITEIGPAAAPVRVVYMRDPEGNILEIEEDRGAVQSSS